MTDPTEDARRQQQAEIAAEAADRAALEARHGRVWDTRELAHDYVVVGFLAPLVAVRRKSDGALGSLEFQNTPRYYFNFSPH